MKAKSAHQIKQKLLIGFGMAVSPALFGSVVVLENFESFGLGSQSASTGGTFTIVDGVGTIGSGNAAQIDAASMTHKFAWGGDAQPVITVSFDLFSGSEIIEAQPLRFSFNLDGGGLVSSGSNIVRLAMKSNGTFDFENTDAVDEVYTDATFPHNTAMTLHMVFNSSAAPVTYAGGGILAANSIELWKEISGVLSHVGYAPFKATLAESPLAFMGFATNSSYGSEGDFIVDNLRYADGVAVVPEPSTYAALAGLLALGLVIARRRARS
jgi:hypothetical protein